MDGEVVSALSFADDTVLCASSKVGTHTQLDRLHNDRAAAVCFRSSRMGTISAKVFFQL